jgi:NO-binding membrane sensor protein with MHYT domain
VLQLHFFTDGPLVPVLSYVVSCLGLFLGLRCATRARACGGVARTRWLLLAGVSIGAAGIWAMGFIAMLGFAVAGEPTRYNVPLALASLLVAIAVATAGLLIVGPGRDEARALPGAGLAAGLGATAVIVLAMGAMRMPGRLSYDPVPFTLAVAVAVAAATAVMWGADLLRGTWSTLAASLGLALAFCGMHFTMMAAVRLTAATVPAGLVAGDASGAGAGSFLLPVVVGVSVLLFLVWAAVALAPTEEAIMYDAALIDHIRQRTGEPPDETALPPALSIAAASAPPPRALGGFRGRPGPR